MTIRQIPIGIYATLACLASPASWALTVSEVPLFLNTGGKANILMILDNSNSMDEAPNGAAVGSFNANSKSEVARNVIRNMINDYADAINMGLMTYKQGTLSSYYLHNSPYDISYNPANYNPDYDLSIPGARDSTTKKFRSKNPSDASNYVHYNVALPFYASSNQGKAFCYSNTADFDNGSETYPDGPWDSYRCYKDKTGTSDTLPAANGTGAAGAGYSNYWLNSSFHPTDSDLAQGLLDFGRFMSWEYVGRTWFRNDSPGRGFLDVPLKNLDATQVNTLQTKLACNVPSPSAPCTNTGIRNAGLTPIQGTLKTARDYFAGTLNKTDEGYSASIYPLPESCGKNFSIMLTDGLPSTDETGVAYVDPAEALSDAENSATLLKNANVETYVIGFALPASVPADTLDNLAKAAGGHDTAYMADDAASLEAAMKKILDDIAKKTGSASAISSNTSQLNTDSTIYQAKLNSDDWSGDLVAYEINETTGNIDSELWKASSGIPEHSSRKIYSWDSAGNDGLVFKWGNLTSAQQTLIDPPNVGQASSLIFDYLRGDQTNEKPAPDGYRIRSTVFGDVGNSDPHFIGKYEDFGYGQSAGLTSAERKKYPTYLSSKKTREPMLYIGVNDGMLHAVRASNGSEQFTYVPESIFGKLPQLASHNYSHTFFVDGSPTSGDAFLNNAWKTILLASTGAGGKSLFALDVSSPLSFNADSVLWEFTHADLGYTIGQATVAKLNNGKWAAIFGNGYNSVNKTAKLFIVYLDADLSDGWTSGDDYLSITTDDSVTENGMSTPSLYDSDLNGTVDYVYAGDLQGQLWKFDLSNASPSNWVVANKSGTTNVPLVKARNATNQIQPITGQPEIGEPPSGQAGVMIYFGTGRYFAVGDGGLDDIQSFYGIWDSFVTNNQITYAACNLGSCDRTSALSKQEILYEGIDTGNPDLGRTAGADQVRVTSLISEYDIYPAKRGWYMDLMGPSGDKQGERFVGTPLLRHHRVIFTTVIPNDGSVCDTGSSWLMELDAKSGSRLTYSAFDMNNDDAFDDKDFVKVTIDGTPTTVAISSKKSTVGIVDTPAVITTNTKEIKYLSGSTASISQVSEKSGSTNTTGRVSWHELMNE